VEKAIDLLPANCPAVTATNLDPRAPAPIMQRKAVSECHSVDSQPVCPDRINVVNAINAILDPKTVTDADPVATLLYPIIALKMATSAENTADMLAVDSPTVITARRVPRAAWLARQRTDDSDSHAVFSQPVCPTRTAAVYDVCPNPAPYKVTDDEPDPIRLLLRA